MCIYVCCCYLVTKMCLTVCNIPCMVACQASLFFTISLSLLKLMFIELVMLSNYLILCHPLLLLQSICPSISVFPVTGLVSSGGQVQWNVIQPLKDNEILPFIATWINLEGIMLSEISQKKTNTTCSSCHLYVEPKKYNQLVNITKKQTHRYREQVGG